MGIDTLEDLYLEQIQRLHSGNKQAKTLTLNMAKAATDPELVLVLRVCGDSIRDGIGTLQAIARRHNEGLHAEHCKAMAVLVSEAHLHALESAFRENVTRDAMIIVQCQRLVHYSIAGYACLIAFARRLDLREDVGPLRACLDAKYGQDRMLINLAVG